MINLTPQERKKFAEYLEQEAETNKGMIAQVEKMGIPAMATVLKRDLAAYVVVASKFRNAEEVSL